MKLIRMNERIIELNAQADKYAWEKVGKKYDEFGSLNRSLNWEWEDTKMEKFAELIIQECVNVSLKSSHRSDDMGVIIAGNIEEHFGVAE